MYKFIKLCDIIVKRNICIWRNIMNKKLIATILFTGTLFTATLSNIGFNSIVKAEETNLSPKEQIEQNKIIEQSKKDAEKIIKNWDKIKVMPAKEYEQRKIEKEKALEDAGIEQPKERQKRSANTIYPQYVGQTGDILVTPESVSGYINGNGSLTGHAGMINLWHKYTTESFPDGGVQRRNNDWKTRYKKFICGEPKGVPVGPGLAAARYAESHQGFGYNWNFANKTTTDRFYCSQLVWRAWYNQGYDLDVNGGLVVSPADIMASPKLNVFYKQG